MPNDQCQTAMGTSLDFYMMTPCIHVYVLSDSLTAQNVGLRGSRHSGAWDFSVTEMSGCTPLPVCMWACFLEGWLATGRDTVGCYSALQQSGRTAVGAGAYRPSIWHLGDGSLLVACVVACKAASTYQTWMGVVNYWERGTVKKILGDVGLFAANVDILPGLNGPGSRQATEPISRGGIVFPPGCPTMTSTPTDRCCRAISSVARCSCWWWSSRKKNHTGGRQTGNRRD